MWGIIMKLHPNHMKTTLRGDILIYLKYERGIMKKLQIIMSCVVLTLLLTGCHDMSASESTTTTTVYDVYNGIDDIVIDGLSEEDNKYINSQDQTLDTMYIKDVIQKK